MRLFLSALVLAAFVVSACAEPAPHEADSDLTTAPAWATLSGQAPQVIAHRGASGIHPEHTVSAYRRGFEDGADILEPDLMVSRDGVLIVRHDPYLSTSTNIADHHEFADRVAERNGRLDWWVSDFTAEELGSLSARQVFADRDQTRNDVDAVLTFDDFLDFVDVLETECGCTIAIEPEVKLPAEHAALGLDPLPLLLDILDERGLNTAEAPIIVQSFNADFLRQLDRASEVRLAMLYAGPDEPGYDADGLSLAEIAQFADAVGPNKAVLFDTGGASSGYLETAHALGLSVHAWTVRDDRAPVVGASVEAELEALYRLGVDGVFTDHPATAVRVRRTMAEASGLPLSEG
ncbi:MAG: glycerophosphodiester phosphodiesterase family protein [Pseudomonadota bacterium]